MGQTAGVAADHGLSDRLLASLVERNLLYSDNFIDRRVVPCNP